MANDLLEFTWQKCLCHSHPHLPPPEFFVSFFFLYTLAPLWSHLSSAPEASSINISCGIVHWQKNPLRLIYLRKTFILSYLTERLFGSRVPGCFVHLQHFIDFLTVLGFIIPHMMFVHTVIFGFCGRGEFPTHDGCKEVSVCWLLLNFNDFYLCIHELSSDW